MDHNMKSPEPILSIISNILSVLVSQNQWLADISTLGRALETNFTNKNTWDRTGSAILWAVSNNLKMECVEARSEQKKIFFAHYSEGEIFGNRATSIL